MVTVRDDPWDPDPGFADLYGRLPDAAGDDLEPWLALARQAGGPVLYLGIGAGRLAVPLRAAGVLLVGVDAHPGMLDRLRRRLPAIELHQGLIEEIDLGRRFQLVMVPSNILGTAERLAGAARHLAPGGRLAFELTNPHWVAAGAGHGFEVRRMDTKVADIRMTYPDGTIQAGVIPLVWPESVEAFLDLEGLELIRLWGRPGADLDESPTFHVLARSSRP
ncbi:MAG: class I SAM-dependent methyltransferase [Candidatus Dormibacteraceae bacterium]